MRKVILAVTIMAVLTLGTVGPLTFKDLGAQIGAESRVLVAILGLTEVIKSQTEDLDDTTDNIWDDLWFKKKFYQARFNVTQENAVGLYALCNLPREACGFPVESMQFRNATAGPDVGVGGIITDNSFSVIPFQFVPSNVLLSSGIGEVGASFYISAILPFNYTGDVEFSGEKPQRMLLLPLVGGSANHIIDPINGEERDPREVLEDICAFLADEGHIDHEDCDDDEISLEEAMERKDIVLDHHDLDD